MVDRLDAIGVDVARFGGFRTGPLKHDRRLLERMHITVNVHVLELRDHRLTGQLVEASELFLYRLGCHTEALGEALGDFKWLNCIPVE